MALNKTGIIQTIIQALTLVAVVIALIIPARVIISKIDVISKDVEEIRKSSIGTIATSPKRELVVDKPADGAEVGYHADVKGYTDNLELNHYVVVIPVLHPSKWVQRWPVVIEPEGKLSSKAQFGEGGIGLGEEFQILLLATSEKLRPGTLDYEPADARWSAPVTVTRTK